MESDYAGRGSITHKTLVSDSPLELSAILSQGNVRLIVGLTSENEGL
jgi:hypothetical protein